MKEKTKEKLFNLFIIVLIIFALIGAYSSGLFVYNKTQEDKLSGWFATSKTLVGSSTNLKTVPIKVVFANTTTTAPTGEYEMLDGSALVTQYVDTNDKEAVILNIMAKGDTATSTLFIRQMSSHDGTNYFDLGTTTQDFVSANQTATSTINAAPVLAVQWDPGLASTSISILFDTYGYRNTRFVIWSDNLTTDTTDGVQAWITAVPVETKY